MYRSAWLALPGLFLALCSSNADSANGWRGNGTGLYPDSTAPLEWYRLPKGLIADLRTRAEGPGENAQGTQLEKGIVREWLILGPSDPMNGWSRHPWHWLSCHIDHGFRSSTPT